MANKSRILLATLALAAVCACEQRPELVRPNLVFVTIDTLRADRLGCYGYFRDTSPVIDQLAGESILFERCLAPMATTYPSHLSLLTSTYPTENGALGNCGAGGEKFVPTERLRSLAQVLRTAGYRTAAFVSTVALKEYTGISAGFDVFDDPGPRERVAATTNAAVFEWLESLDDQNFFLWVHYFDPHAPYLPPTPFITSTKYAFDDRLAGYLAARKFRAPGSVPKRRTTRIKSANNLYDSEISYVDSQLGELLERLRARPQVWDRTVLVLLGDHGEGLGQHGEMRHGGIWQEQLHMPLMMRIPGQSSRRIDRLMSVADIVPTLMGLVELPGKETFLDQASGIDRLAEDPGDEFILSQESGAPWKKRPGGSGPRYVLTGREWNLIHDAGGDDLLFDRRTDPFELHDVRSEHPGVAEKLYGILQTRLELQKERRTVLQPAGPAPGKKLDPDTKEQLRSLGYIR